MKFAMPIEVPLQADPVAAPEFRYGGPVVYGHDSRLASRLIFEIRDEPTAVGRMTFEVLDALRCCRGESMPYATPFRPRSSAWIFAVDESSWLRERHDYEVAYYSTPLLHDYVHYVVTFHDEFFEFIAKGIWLERAAPEDVYGQLGVEHPLANLPDHLPCEEFVVEGIACSVRHNPLSLDELATRSLLCSQPLFEYSITLEGQRRPSYAARLRTLGEMPVTRLQRSSQDEALLAIDGFGAEHQLRSAFVDYVADVAEHRSRMGKSP